VRAGDVPDRVDHRHDHEPEGDCNTDVSELVCLRVDHHRAGSREDERERPERFSDERARERCEAHVAANTPRSAAIASGTRR
jgi:hypothetical protein